MQEIFERVWHDLVARTTGPMWFRMILQPMVATAFGIRAGLRNARRAPSQSHNTLDPAYRRSDVPAGSERRGENAGRRSGPGRGVPAHRPSHHLPGRGGARRTPPRRVAVPDRPHRRRGGRIEELTMPKETEEPGEAKAHLDTGTRLAFERTYLEPGAHVLRLRHRQVLSVPARPGV